MVVYIDNGLLIGWYYRVDGCYLGDGTKETAYEIEKESEVEKK